MNNPTNKQNNLPNFKTPVIFYPLMGFIVLLIIIMFLLFFKVNLNPSSIPKSAEEITANVLIVTFFVLLIFFLCIYLLPNFKSLKDLFGQISNVSYVIIYTISLIIFFTSVPGDFINNYAKYITPITIGLGLLSYYKSIQRDYITEFNVNYERIKMVILMFCLITSYIIFYNKDPGGYISEYFGFSLLLTILIAVFGFLYLIIVLTLPDSQIPIGKGDKSNNFLNNFSNFSVYGSVLFVIFLAIISTLIYSYPGGFFNDQSSGPVMIFLLLICILWSLLIMANLFPEISDSSAAVNKMSLFKRALLVLFGLVVSGLLIFWIVYNIQNLSGQSSIISLVLNLILVLIFLAFIYKTINVNFPVGNTKKNAFFNMIINFIFYIPCIFSDSFDFIGKVLTGQLNASTTGSLLMLLLAIIIFVIYFSMPSLFNKFSLQGGKQLVNKPVYLGSEYALGTYEELNNSSQFDYQYAISSWIFIDAAPPSTNASYSKFTSVLNFGNKPNVLYKGNEHIFMVTMQQKDLNKTTENKLIDFDDEGNIIVYKNLNLPLQKWNNIIINYNGGILDIFLNGELVKSVVGVVPYYTLDNLTIGANNGIKGGICNVIYFSKALTRSNIYYLYETVKNKTPPVMNDSNTTILKNNVSTVESSTKTVINKI
jgi:hypothetical protein